jgi:CRP/FNR family transcriptional regulator, cyclic AMP receptor protein
MDETFLDALTEDEAADLHAAGRRRSYGANTTLFHEGDDAGPVVVLLAGRAKVATIGGAGREAIMAVRGPGDLIGELSAIDGGPRSGTVTTLEPAEALLVPGSAFAGLLERRPRIALVILRMVAGRLRYADSQQTQFATHDVVGRVAQRLVELGERFGEREGDRIEIALPLSQEELASWTGSSREAVSKALQQLRSLDIVATGRRRITVLDPAALRQRAR